MGSIEAQRTVTGWAATDPTGILAPYTYSLRDTGPEDVYVKVICCGICHTDLHQIKNDLGMSNYPMVPGSADMDGRRQRTRIDSDSCVVHKCFFRRSYESNLKNQLEENPNNWSKKYEDWGSFRPRDSACKLIKAIIISVYQFHCLGRIHGYLKFEENYLLHRDPEGNFRVMLDHAVVDGDLSTKTQKGDIEDMLSIIFDTILADVPQQHYPYDLKCLHALIENCDGSDSDWLHIIKHPSLWNYMERVGFILQLHTNLNNDPDVGPKIRSKLKNMNGSLRDWRELVPSKGPLRKFLQRDDGRPRYGEKATEHLRFLRNFISHFRKYAREWNVRYVELQFSKIRTNFVVELFEMVMADKKLRKFFLNCK